MFGFGCYQLVTLRYFGVNFRELKTELRYTVALGNLSTCVNLSALFAPAKFASSKYINNKAL